MAMKYDSLELQQIAEGTHIAHTCGNAVAIDIPYCSRCNMPNLASSNKECPKCGSDFDSKAQIAALKAQILALQAP